jgi:hypothetical protein
VRIEQDTVVLSYRALNLLGTDRKSIEQRVPIYMDELPLWRPVDIHRLGVSFLA